MKTSPTKKLFAIVTALALLTQSFSSVFVYAANAPAAQVFDTRLAVINIIAEYNKNLSPSKMELLSLAAKMYATKTVMPICEKQASADVTQVALSRSQTVEQAASSLISSICYEIEGIGKSMPSGELENVMNAFFAAFFPGQSYTDFSAAIENMDGTQRNQYIDGFMDSNAVSKIQGYITNGGILDLETCTLSPEDTTLYDTARKQYEQALSSQEIAVANQAFDVMQSIKTRVVCTQTQQSTSTLTSDCVNKVSILKSQIALLDSQKNAQEIQKINNSIETISASPDCSLSNVRDTAVPQKNAPFATTQQILNFKGEQDTTPLPGTPAFCAVTADTLRTQLNNATPATISKLMDTIEQVVPQLDTTKIQLANAIKNEAITVFNIKQAALGLVNPPSMMGRMFSALELYANDLFANTAIKRGLELIDPIGYYIDALDGQDFFGGIDGISDLRAMLTEGRTFTWNSANQQFNQENQSLQGLTVVASTDRYANNNNLKFELKELAAIQYKQKYIQPAWSTKVSDQSPTLQELTALYFGGDAGVFGNGGYNRVWYELTKGPIAIWPDATYAAAAKNRSSYTLNNPSSIGIEVFDVNGQYIAVIPDMDARTLIVVPTGVYQNWGTFLDVQAGGKTTISYDSISTYPQSIDTSIYENNILQAALVGNIVWPTNAAPIVQETITEGKSETMHTQYGGVQTDFSKSKEYAGDESFYVGVDKPANTSIEAKKNEATIQVEREDMLPQSVQFKLYANPHTLAVNMQRSYSNGVNTIVFSISLQGGSICNFTIAGTVSYQGNQYGMPDKQNDNPVLSAAVDISFDGGYKVSLSSSQIQQLVQSIQNGGEADIAGLVDQYITNSISMFNDPFAKLRIGSEEEGMILVDYLDTSYAPDNLMTLAQQAFERVQLGWLGELFSMSDDGGSGYEDNNNGGDKDPDKDGNAISPSIDAQVYTAQRSGDDVTIAYYDTIGGGTLQMDSVPSVEVSICQDTDGNYSCQSQYYDMTELSSGSYGISFEPGYLDTVSGVSINAYYQGISIPYTLF